MANSKSNDETLSKFPNLYQMLDLQPLEGDRSRIEAALRRVLTQAKTLKDKQPKQAQQLAKVFELGKLHLLSVARKTAYDTRWQQVFQTSPQLEPSLVTADCDYASLDPLLPTGDPTAAFDLAEFLQASAELPEAQTDADFRKLQNLLQGNPLAIEASPSSTSPSSTSPSSAIAKGDAPTSQPLTGSTVGRVTSQSTSHELLVGTPASKPAPKPRAKQSLAKQLRQKRDRSLLTVIGGVLLSLGVLLGVLFFLLRPAATKSPSKEPQLAAAAQPANNSPRDVAAQEMPPQRSGLPKVTGFNDPATLKPDSVAQPPANPMDNALPPATPEMTPAAALPEMSDNPIPSPASIVPMQAAAPPQTPSPPEPTLSEGEQAQWRKSISSIRDALGRQEYPTAIELLAKQTETAKTSQQKAELSRLDAAAKLAEQFHSALVEAILSLEAGETFKVKSTDVSFVGGSETRVSIRMLGKNESYDLVDIPLGLAFALADLKLDTVHPSSLAKKSAFSWLHPKNSRLVLQQAREWMAQAAADGVVAEDMPLIFDDGDT